MTPKEQEQKDFLIELKGKINQHPDFICDFPSDTDIEYFIWVRTKDELLGTTECHYEVIFNSPEEGNPDVASVEVHFERENFRDFQKISLSKETEERLTYFDWYNENDRRIVYKDRDSEENNSHRKIIDKLIELERLIGVELRNVVSRKLADDEREALLETLAFARNPDAVKAALQSSGYKCEIGNHTSFTDKNGQNYVEGHHLIPMSKEAYFDKSLNQAANIVCLCPNCHREIHYGANRQALVKTLLTPQRQTDLRSAGLNVTLKKLQSYY